MNEEESWIFSVRVSGRDRDRAREIIKGIGEIIFEDKTEVVVTLEEHEKIRKLSMLAAFVDGEGNISIVRALEPSGYSYTQRTVLTNTDLHLIEWAMMNFGGKLPKAHSLKENSKEVYQWVVYGVNSYKLLKKIHPYLILKQEQADLAIELYEKVSKFHYNRLPSHKRKLAEELYERCKELNRKGINNNEVADEIEEEHRMGGLEGWILK